MSKILTGANAVVKINGKSIAWAVNAIYTETTTINQETQAFLDFLKRTGSSAAADLLARTRLPIDIMGSLDLGTARQPGETDKELRKRLGKDRK